jgi:hypothetical protein
MSLREAIALSMHDLDSLQATVRNRSASRPLPPTTYHLFDVMLTRLTMA